jgi:hypothetical protein
MNYLKNFLLIAFVISILITNISLAEAPPQQKIKAVYGMGLAWVEYGLSDSEILEKAKLAAYENAKSKCEGPAEIAENLGWEIKYIDQTPCHAHQFCDGDYDYITAKAVFACVAN